MSPIAASKILVAPERGDVNEVGRGVYSFKPKLFNIHWLTLLAPLGRCFSHFVQEVSTGDPHPSVSLTLDSSPKMGAENIISNYISVIMLYEIFIRRRILSLIIAMNSEFVGLPLVF